MLITIGAPIKDVMILIGKVPNGKTSVNIENNKVKNIPDTIIQRYNNFISPVFKIDRQIWGIAKPIKPIGPVNAVAAAVNKAVEIKINKRSCFTLIPNERA